MDKVDVFKIIGMNTTEIATLREYITGDKGLSQGSNNPNPHIFEEPCKSFEKLALEIANAKMPNANKEINILERYENTVIF